MSSGPIANPNQAPTVEQFLADFPKFDTSEVTDPAALQISPNSIAYWLQIATTMLNQNRLGNMYYTACELFVAHNVALEAWAEQGGDQTVPGISKGAIAANSDGQISLTYNNAAVLEGTADHWQYTSYGQRMRKLIQLFGAGPLIVGVPGRAPYGSGGAWNGIWCFNIPSPNGPG
jgi:hypothetical protein